MIGLNKSENCKKGIINVKYKYRESVPLVSEWKLESFSHPNAEPIKMHRKLQ